MSASRPRASTSRASPDGVSETPRMVPQVASWLTVLESVAEADSLEAAADADKKTYPNGVIGRKLSDDERYDVIEYLKTL